MKSSEIWWEVGKVAKNRLLISRSEVRSLHGPPIKSRSYGIWSVTPFYFAAPLLHCKLNLPRFRNPNFLPKIGLKKAKSSSSWNISDKVMPPLVINRGGKVKDFSSIVTWFSRFFCPIGLNAVIPIYWSSLFRVRQIFGTPIRGFVKLFFVSV